MKYHNKKIICCIGIIVISVVFPLYSFSQRMWSEQSRLLSQFNKSNADTGRVDICLKLSKYYLLREYYLYKSGTPKTQLDSASFFAEQALNLSRVLKYKYGNDEANLLRGDAFIRKHDVNSALSILNTLRNSTRFRLLIILSRNYLFHSDRSKTDLDSALFFLEKANRMAPKQLSAKVQSERIHVKAMRSFILEGLQPSLKLYMQLIKEIDVPGNEDRVALIWHELSTLIPANKKTDITQLYCFEKMLTIYNKINNQEREAWTLKSIADIHLVNGKLDLAETAYSNALDLYRAIGYRDLHYIYELLAVTCRNKGEFRKCNFYALKAIESIQATNDPLTSHTFYKRLADLYRQSGQPDKSTEWYLKTVNSSLYKKGNNVYKFRNADFFARGLIKMKREKEALTYILEIKAKDKPIGIYAQACLFSSLAYCYEAVKQERMAEKYYSELIKLAARLQKNNEITCDVYYEIGRHFIDQRQYSRASTYLQTALTISESVHTRSQTKDIYLMLYKANYAVGKYNSAIQYILRHNLLNDSLFNETKSWQIEELGVQYETAKKDKDIKLLNSQNQLQRIKATEADRTKNITLAGGTLLLIIIGLLFNRYLIKEKSNRRHKANEKELDQKNRFLETLNTDQKKLLNEKEWLIKEVHHRVKNNLQMVTSLLYSQSVYLHDNAAKLAVKDSLRRMEAMALIHQKLYRDENTTTIAMPEYINDLVRYLHESFDNGNQIAFMLTVEPLQLDDAKAIPLGLIITEGIVNAIKHAFLNGRKGVVSIDFQQDSAGYLLLKISDNGGGLPENLDTLNSGSLGLNLIQGLTKQLNGHFQILNDNGVHIIIRFST